MLQEIVGLRVAVYDSDGPFTSFSGAGVHSCAGPGQGAVEIRRDVDSLKNHVPKTCHGLQQPLKEQPSMFLNVLLEGGCGRGVQHGTS